MYSTFSKFFFSLFLATNESFVAILLSLTLPSFCNKFTQEGCKGVYTFFYGRIGMGLVACIAMGKVLLRIGVQFPYKFLVPSLYNFRIFYALV
jgi:hypothetical protein